MSTTLDIERLELAVQDALARNDEAALHVLGYGEISPVVAWPTPSGPWACKRLPIFDAPDRFEAYRSTFDDYLATLSARGVVVHDTALESVELPDGRIAAYCVQPALGATRFGPALLRDADEADGQALLGSVIDHVADAVSADVGLDAQVSNWARHGDDLVYVDVTTPLLRDADGRDRLDTEMFLASLPAALRPIVRRFFLQGILDPYYAWRSAALDLLANLYKEGLARVGPFRRPRGERTTRRRPRGRRSAAVLPQRSSTVGRAPTNAPRRPFLATSRASPRVPVPASWSDRPAHLIRVHSVSTGAAGTYLAHLGLGCRRVPRASVTFDGGVSTDSPPPIGNDKRGVEMAVQPVPEGYPTVTPYLVVDGAADAIDLYVSLFGATERLRMPGPDDSIGHAELEIGESVIMLSDHFPDMGYRGPKDVGGTPVTIMVYVSDVDDVFTRAIAAGAKEIRPVENQFYGDRSGQFEDPFGHRWNVSTHVEDVPPDEMAKRAAAAAEAEGTLTRRPTHPHAARPSTRGHPAVRWLHGHRDSGRLRCRPAPRP